MATNSSFTSRFPESKFRDAITNTMLMGMPNKVADQLTWYWKRVVTHANADPAGVPYDFNSNAITDEPKRSDLPDPGAGVDQSLIVTYAAEFQERRTGTTDTVLGEIDNSGVRVTLMDTQYEQVFNSPADAPVAPDYAKIGTSTYRIQYVEPVIGLFGFDEYTIILEAVDEA